MLNMKLKIFMAAALAVQLTAAFADPGSGRIAVTVRGHGPDVLLIPGLTCSADVWDSTAACFESQYRLHNSCHFIMLDQPEAFQQQVGKFLASP